MTGFELGRIFDTRISHSFTGFLDATKKNRIFKEALVELIEDKYAAPQRQEIADDLSFLITTGKTLVPINNQFFLTPLQVTTVTFVTTTITVNTYLPHGLSNGDTVTVAGVSGFTTNNPNGTFVINTVTSNSFKYTAGSAPTGAHTANTGKVSFTRMLTNYGHMLSLKALFREPYYDVTITGLSYSSPIKMDLSWYSRLRTGQKIYISGALGNTNANGTHYVKKLSDKKFALYSDESLQTPVSGNGNYTSGAVLNEVFYEEAKPYYPATKISNINEPTVISPRYEEADNNAKIYPLTKTCLEVTMDYLKTPEVIADTADTVIDLELYYGIDFIYEWLDKAIELGSAAMRDTEMFKYAKQNEQ